jgi:hypothetical protein
MRYYLDCEFDSHNGPLLSMALVDEVGQGIYLCVPDEPLTLSPWVAENVWPLVHARIPIGRTVAFLPIWGELLRRFLAADYEPVVIADSVVDIARFCQTISTGPTGEWESVDGSIRFEVHDVDAYPTDVPGAVQHNAWWDAMALRHKLAA